VIRLQKPRRPRVDSGSCKARTLAVAIVPDLVGQRRGFEDSFILTFTRKWQYDTDLKYERESREPQKSIEKFTPESSGLGTR
jgi:hypothetical protein